MLKTFQDFCAVLDACTEGYNCLVLDTRIAMRDPKNCIFYYKAQMHPETFHVGREIFWQLSEQLYVDRSDNDMEVSRVLGVDPLKPGTAEIRSKSVVIKKVDSVDKSKRK